ncbi:MAG: hypothetical protein JEZ01_21125 [Labilibaculum sp.]|nr:hypothetical protein [Labilibaculum sp.]MBI9060283.1 hypothetical protein [Labilibaculum sp.]
MPFLEHPKSDAARLELMDRCITTSEQDNATEVKLLPKQLVAELTKRSAEFRTVSTESNASMSARQKETREKNEAKQNLEVVVRDFFEVVKRRTYRMNHPVEVLRFYNMTSNADLPRLKSETEILDAAVEIVTGDAKAVEAGYPAMQNPTAAEVEEQLSLTRKEISDLAPADRALNKVQKEMRNMREPIDEMIRDIADCLQFALRKETASNARRIIRLYGFKYRYLQGEPIDEIVESNISEN